VQTLCHPLKLALLASGGPREFAGQSGPGGPWQTKRVHPLDCLGKLLKTLADAGLLESQKGKGGGFRLARDPAAIKLSEALEPFEHVHRWSGCFLGRASCSDHAPCSMHRRWRAVRDVYLQFLSDTTVADLISGVPATASS